MHAIRCWLVQQLNTDDDDDDDGEDEYDDIKHDQSHGERMPANLLFLYSPTEKEKQKKTRRRSCLENRG